jgi:RNA polymerase sigma-70 factor (ECF subfamily)
VTAFETGRARWPGLELDESAFAAFVAERDLDEADIDGDRAADLFLACACAAAIDGAADRFVAAFRGDLERATARLQTPGVSADDAHQELLRRLLVGDAGPAKIASYAGRGSLRSWVRAVAARAVIDLHRRGGGVREVGVDEPLIDSLVATSDPEIDYLKHHYRSEFRAAFEVAVARLDARARNHLRHVFVDQLGVDQLASLYSCHRSTAARRVAAARDALLAETRAVLIDRLEVSEDELDSIMRLIDSRFEVSVQRIFGEPRDSQADGRA